MVQAIYNAAGGVRTIRRIEEELDRQLRSSPSYRLIKRAAVRWGWNLEKQLYMWNDLPWRKQYEVIAALDGLANRLEATARAEECKRLEAKIETLLWQIGRLTKYVEGLEADTPWLRGRLRRNSELKQSRAELEALRSELEGQGLLLGRLRQVA